MMKVSVIVAGAGAGRRFGGKGNKIFQRIGGNQPIFIRTLEAFTSRQDVCQVQLVVAEADMAELRQRFAGALGFMGVKVVAGGPTRTDSVRNALANVSDEADFVCVHDAVRPCIAQQWIDDVFAAAERTGAAILACPVHGTLKAVKAGPKGPRVERTLERQELWEAQTPQVFRKEVLLAAYASGGPATDDAALVEATGYGVTLVPGDPRNIKITTPADLAFASAVIGTLPKPKDKGFSHPFAEAQW